MGLGGAEGQGHFGSPFQRGWRWRRKPYLNDSLIDHVLLNFDGDFHDPLHLYNPFNLHNLLNFHWHFDLDDLRTKWNVHYVGSRNS